MAKSTLLPHQRINRETGPIICSAMIITFARDARDLKSERGRNVRWLWINKWSMEEGHFLWPPVHHFIVIIISITLFMLPRRSVLLYCAIFARDVGLECLPSVVVARKWIGSSTCARTRIFISGQVTEKCLKCISCFISATCKKSDKSLCLPLGDTIRASRVTRTRSVEARRHRQLWKAFGASRRTREKCDWPRLLCLTYDNRILIILSRWRWSLSAE